MEAKFKFKVASKVLFNNVPYEVEAQLQGENGNWYLLLNRLGYVHESELKKQAVKH